MKRAGKGQLYENRKKEAIRLKKRYHDLRMAEKALPLVPLSVLIRNGWERIFVVREDVKKGPHGKFLEKLLTKINTTAYCRTKDFMEYDYKTNKMKPIEQELKMLIPEEYEKLSPQEKREFNKEYRRIKYWFDTKTVEVYVINKPWRFVWKIRPSYLTHEKIVDGDIESELHKISQKLWSHGRMELKYCDHGYSDKDLFDVTPDDKIEKIVEKEMEEWTE